MKILTINILLGFIILTSCSWNNNISTDSNSTDDRVNVKSDFKLKIGDCLIFSDTTLSDFGLVLIENNLVNNNTELSLFPVQLDKTEHGIEQFTKGCVYVHSYPDFTARNGIREGMSAFHFLSYTEFESIYKDLKVIDNIKIKTQYLNVTGGMMALTKTEFSRAFSLWKELFGVGGKLTNVNEIINND